jgi:hypothetical protein
VCSLLTSESVIYRTQELRYFLDKAAFYATYFEVPRLVRFPTDWVRETYMVPYDASDPLRQAPVRVRALRSSARPVEGKGPL